jgi:carboxypeptidase T
LGSKAAQPVYRWRQGLIGLLGLAVVLLVAWVQPVTAQPLAQVSPLRVEPAPPTLIVARVYFGDEEMLIQLASVLDVWEVRHQGARGEGYVVAMLSLAQAQALQATGVRVELDEARTADLQQPVQTAGQQVGIPGFACYRTVEETEAALAALATTYPTLARWVDIGDSWNQLNPGNGAGHDLQVLVLTNSNIPGPKPRFFLMAAIHARELTTAEVATRFAEELITGYGRNPDATWLLDATEIHILSLANPDGRKWAEQLLYWRKNTNRADGCASDSPFFSYYGVDLNRNSSFKWGQCEGAGCSTNNACRDTFRGSGPASEPETQAIQNYVTGLFPDQRGPADTDPASVESSGLFISLHSYSELVLFPWGWRSTPSPNHTQLQTLGHKFGYFTGYGVCQSGSDNCLYMTDGTTDDWAYGELGVAAYTFEIGTAFFEQCSDFESNVLPETLSALRYAAKAAWRPYQTPAGPESLQVTVTPTRIISGTPVLLTAQVDDTRYASNTGVQEPTQPITAARYTVAAPSWISGTLHYTMTIADGQFDAPVEEVQATVNTAGWPAGRHLVLVEGQDAAGNWGVPSGVFVEVLASPFAVALEPQPLTSTLAAGSPYTFTVVVTNTGLVSDTYAVNGVLNGWAISLPATIGPLAPGSSVPFPVAVTAPATLVTGTTEILTLTIASQSDGTVLATAPVTLRVIASDAVEIFFPWIDDG